MNYFTVQTNIGTGAPISQGANNSPDPNWVPGNTIHLGTSGEQPYNEIDYLDPVYIGSIDQNGNPKFNDAVVSQIAVVHQLNVDWLNGILDGIKKGAYPNAQNELVYAYTQFNGREADLQAAQLRAQARIINSYNTKVAQSLDTQHQEVLSAMGSLQSYESGITGAQNSASGIYGTAVPQLSSAAPLPASPTVASPVSILPVINQVQAMTVPAAPAPATSGVAPLAVGGLVAAKLLL